MSEILPLTLAEETRVVPRDLRLEVRRDRKYWLSIRDGGQRGYRAFPLRKLTLPKDATEYFGFSRGVLYTKDKTGALRRTRFVHGVAASRKLSRALARKEKKP